MINKKLQDETMRFQRQILVLSFYFYIPQFFTDMQTKDNTFIDDMTKMILRPRRDIYHPDRLGPSQIIVKTKNKESKSEKNVNTQYVEVTRKDCKVQNKGENIALSYYHAAERESKEKATQEKKKDTEVKSKRCVVYLHANSGSRIQGLQLVKYILPFGWSLALFDYRGSGISDGQYTSMGVTQAQDLSQILSYLSKSYNITEFSLWGRSMGAVTILYYLTTLYSQQKSSQNITIRAIVLDSPFSNMKKLMYEIGSNTIHLPEFVFLPIISSITDKLTQKIGVDIVTQLNLIDKIKKIEEKDRNTFKNIASISALFLTSTEDKLVHCSHVEELHKCFPFEQKELYYYNGEHNDSRSDGVKNKGAEFVCHNAVKEKEKIGLSQGQQSEKVVPMPRRSEAINKNKKIQIDDGRQTQFLLPPNQKRPDINSPKYQKTRILDFSTKNISKESPTQSKQQAKQQKSSTQKTCPQPRLSYENNSNHNFQHFSHNPFAPHPSSSPYPTHQAAYSHQIPHPYMHQQLPPPPHLHSEPRFDSSQNQSTIIINHNYNVSFNIFEPKRSLQFSPDHIPPINFNQPGHMTDRYSEHPIPGNRYFIPHTAKIQRKYDNTSLSNLSNASGDSGMANSFTFQPSGKSTLLPGNQTNFGRENHISQSQQLPNSCGKIDIPLLKFEGLDYDLQRQEDHSSSGFKRPEKIQKMIPSRGVVGSLICGERQKMSLAELRRMQKEEQQRCVMKSSKIISYKDRQSDLSDDFEKLNLKREAMLQEDSWKYNIEQTDKNKLRSMKTSLMARRKPGDRKGSDSVSGNIKSFIEKKPIIPPENPLGGLFSMGRAMIHSPKGQQPK